MVIKLILLIFHQISIQNIGKILFLVKSTLVKCPSLKDLVPLLAIGTVYSLHEKSQFIMKKIEIRQKLFFFWVSDKLYVAS